MDLISRKIVDTTLQSEYDCIADKYDSLFTDTESLKENEYVAERLRKISGSVFDVGCGTGLLLDLIKIEPSKYFGCDPSRKMLNNLKQQHPLFAQRVQCSTFEDCQDFVNYDNVISTFGSISYIRPKYIKRLAAAKSRKFLMFYKPEYTPVTYIKTNVYCFHYRYTIETLREVFSDCKVEYYNNYIIVSNI